MEHGSGVTRNVSPSGVFFECSPGPTRLTPGAAISFSLEFNHARGEALQLNKVSAKGEILRVEQHAEKVGVAAAIKAYKFEPERPEK